MPYSALSCRNVPREMQEKCCYKGHYTSAGKYVGLEIRRQPTGSMSRMPTMRSPKTPVHQALLFLFHLNSKPM
ncbi:hypothetical protein PGT21_024207 [Puccinia graminis f. sp. tritici]|uniref:Uncharacterized protein n=1 Tax=Puccinia graminis f. sp. tritici TaxID=56615 RepID=A0A5B0MNK1_PUCGR|nr:hypothetical protein PGT21_024207 [Puccinia graminis f. sp. tritici]